MARVVFVSLNSSISSLSGDLKLPTPSFKRATIVCNSNRQLSIDEARESGSGTSRSFGRLKVQRVRKIVKESARKKTAFEDNDEKAETTPTSLPFEAYNDPDVLDSEKDLSVQKWKYTRKGRQDNTQYESKAVKAYNDPDVLDSEKDLSVQKWKYTRKGRHDDTRYESKGVPSSKFSAPSSRGWGDVGTTDRYSPREDDTPRKWQNLKAGGEFFSRKSFNELGCADYVLECLKKLQYQRPSHIQAMTFEPAIGGKSCIIADQSGSGKTLAYLVPIIQRLRQEELEGLGKPESTNPRVVVLVPTAELASQVLTNCRALSKAGVPFRSMVATGGFKQKTQLESLRQELDVLIATPGRFMFLVRERFLELTDIKSAVLDEVDILFKDEDFELALQTLVNCAPVTTQYLFVTATLPLEIYNKLVQNFPDCEVVMGPGMHRTSDGLEEILIDCSGDENAERTPDTAFLNKKNALLQLVERSPVTKTIIFCNKIETCRKVENALKRLDRKATGMKVLPFHAALEQESRLANMKEFRSFPSKNISMFLVCTDRASRGIDFEGVDHVLLFDFPRDPSEYVRRVGRTARGAGGKGKAYVFAVGKQVPLARKVIERNKKGHPLHDVPSAYEVMR